jgi:repressor LexA
LRLPARRITKVRKRLTTTHASGICHRMAMPLTQMQEKVLEAIRRRLDLGESPPTYRELCAEFGWASTGTARDHLRALARKGLIDLAEGQARQVRIRQERAQVQHVPLVGRVVAGLPVNSEEFQEGVVPVPVQWSPRGEAFALRVLGESMENAGIFEGDIIIVRRQVTASDGDIVVATLDGETTVKRLRKSKGQILLVAENPRFRSIPVPNDSLVIHGVVVGLLREYRSKTRQTTVNVPKGKQE